MEERGYDAQARAEHSAEHQRFIGRVRELRSRLYNGEKILGDTACFAIEWLDSHLAKTDMRFIQFLRQQRGDLPV